MLWGPWVQIFFQHPAFPGINANTTSVHETLIFTAARPTPTPSRSRMGVCRLQVGTSLESERFWCQIEKESKALRMRANGCICCEGLGAEGAGLGGFACGRGRGVVIGHTAVPAVSPSRGTALLGGGRPAPGVCRVITHSLAIWQLLLISAFRKCSFSHLWVVSCANPSTGDQHRERGRLQRQPWAGRAWQGAPGPGHAAGPRGPAADAPGAAAPGAEPQQRGPRRACWAPHASAPRLAVPSRHLTHRRSL